MEEKKSIKKLVLEKIESGKTAMKPKWHFALKAVLAGTGIFIFFLLSLFVFSFIVFALHKSGAWFVPAFGSRGIGGLFSAIPWVLVGAGIIFIVVLEVLARKYAFAYRKPLLYSVVGIVVLVISGGLAVSATRMHDSFSRFVMEKDIPFAGPIYKEFHMKRFPDVHPGIVREIKESGFLLENELGGIYDVFVTRATRFPFGSEIEGGDSVVVMGERKENVIRAFGVRRVDEDFVPFREFKGRGNEIKRFRPL